MTSSEKHSQDNGSRGRSSPSLPAVRHSAFAKHWLAVDEGGAELTKAVFGAPARRMPPRPAPGGGMDVEAGKGQRIGELGVPVRVERRQHDVGHQAGAPQRSHSSPSLVVAPAGRIQPHRAGRATSAML